MKEIRGQEAVRYAEEQGLFFSADEDYMLRAESALLRRPATLDDIDALFEARLGTDYDRTNLFPGEDSFNLLVERYGYGWICVALEGKHPEEEESVLLGMFRSLLKEEEPSNGGDVLDLATVYGPELRDTGFPGWATTNLLFHAALRLASWSLSWTAGRLLKTPRRATETGSFLSHQMRRLGFQRCCVMGVKTGRAIYR